mmetsp:Transcript_10050/g.15213  ORF Transcript_10050/g.15213 Transcript_10050/m.15213 type:complete len:392 (-) Transcript_10050:128-1303(-)
MDTTNTVELDWYAVLNCSIESTKEQIEKAARQLARKYHPDRNKKADAPQLFLNVQRAKEYLLDDSKRRTYDENLRKISKRKEYDLARNRNMDSKRKKMKEDLEARLGKAEKAAQSDAFENPPETKKSRRERDEEISRLRRDAQARMDASNQQASNDTFTAEDILKHRSTMADSSSDSLVQIKVKWKRNAISHSDDSLCQLFRTFGQIEDCTILQGKGNSAVITFATHASASAAVNSYENSHDLRVTLLGDKKKPAVFTHVYTNTGNGHFKSSSTSNNSGPESRESDVMREVRRAVEREQLVKQMMESESKGFYSGATNATEFTRNTQSSNTVPSAFPSGNSVPQYGVDSNSSSTMFQSSNSASNSHANLAAKENDILAKMMQQSKNKSVTA